MPRPGRDVIGCFEPDSEDEPGNRTTLGDFIREVLLEKRPLTSYKRESRDGPTKPRKTLNQ